MAPSKDAQRIFSFSNASKTHPNATQASSKLYSQLCSHLYHNESRNHKLQKRINETTLTFQ